MYVKQSYRDLGSEVILSPCSRFEASLKSLVSPSAEKKGLKGGLYTVIIMKNNMHVILYFACNFNACSININFESNKAFKEPRYRPNGCTKRFKIL